MIELTDVEFENCVKRLINGETTRVKLAKELKTDTRTLLNRIYNISNEELFDKYLEEYAYKPKKNENIDYEKLIVEMIKYGEKAEQAQIKYDIAGRTYRRNIKRLETVNPKLYNLYKNYLHNTLTYEDKEYIETLQEGIVSVSDSIEDRKAYLISMFVSYDELLASGLEYDEALRSLNETNRSFKRKNDELDRILKEDETKRSNKQGDSKKSDFVNKLKVENINIVHDDKNNIANTEVEREL